VETYESFNRRHSLSDIINIRTLVASSHSKRIVLSLTKKGSETYLITDWMRLENGVLTGNNNAVLANTPAAIEEVLSHFHINRIG